MSRCHLCGRACSVGAPTEMYVFGPVCGRAKCRAVRAAIPDAYKTFFFAASLPVEGGDGRPSAWTADGERQPTKGASA